MSYYTPSQDWFRRSLRPFGGLRFIRRRSDGALILLSRHHPHLLCWSWVVAWERRKAISDRRNARFWSPFIMRHNNGGSAWWGPLRIDWQNYRMRRYEPRRADKEEADRG